MRALLLCAALALATAGCDSSTPEPPVTGPPVTGPPVAGPPVVLRSFNLSGLPSQTEIELTDADTISVPGLFGSGRPAGVALRVTATGGATAIGTSAALVVRAEALGDALVTLGVSAPGYRDTTATLAVRVVPGICPPPAPAGLSDLYPIANGTRRSYTYNESAFLDFLTQTRVGLNGVLTSEIDAIICFNRRRTFRITYHFVGTTLTTSSGTPLPYPPPDPYEASRVFAAVEDPSNVVTIPLPGFVNLFSNVRVPRFSPQAEATYAPNLRFCPNATATFRADVGLTHDLISCIRSGTQSMTILP